MVRYGLIGFAAAILVATVWLLVTHLPALVEVAGFAVGEDFMVAVCVLAVFTAVACA